jgi:hypothetical protein
MLPPENAGSIVRAAPINVIGMLRHHLAPSHDNNFLWKQNEVVDGQRVQESTSWEMVQFIELCGFQENEWKHFLVQIQSMDSWGV